MICQITKPIFDSKMAIDSPIMKTNIYQKLVQITDGVGGHVTLLIGNFFDNLTLLALPGRPAASNENKADESTGILSWDTSKHTKTTMIASLAKVLKGHMVIRCKFRLKWCITCF